MFADSLFDSHGTGRSQRGWTTLTSFALQTLGIAIVLTLPQIYTEGLPKLHLVSMSAPLPPPGPPPVTQQQSGARPAPGNLFHGIMVAPQTVPVGVTQVIDDSVPQDAAPCAICVNGGTGVISTNNPVWGALGNTAAVVLPPPPKPAARPPRVSTMMEGNLIYKVQPIYPPLARAARIQGPVHVRAFITRTGTIENLQAIDGHPMLVGSAIDAVRQWRYRPYILNGDPVEVETQVTVIFSLSGG